MKTAAQKRISCQKCDDNSFFSFCFYCSVSNIVSHNDKQTKIGKTINVNMVNKICLVVKGKTINVYKTWFKTADDTAYVTKNYVNDGLLSYYC